MALRNSCANFSQLAAVIAQELWKSNNDQLGFVFSEYYRLVDKGLPHSSSFLPLELQRRFASIQVASENDDLEVENDEGKSLLFILINL